ncbi:MAG: DMT family transporter [Gammaproteobacteria bacterium]
MSVPTAFIGIIIIWSTTPLAIKWSGEGSGFLFGVSARMTLGVLLCLAIISLFRIKLPWQRSAKLTYISSGLGIYGAMLCVYWGSQFIPSGLIAILFGLTPVMTGILASIWLNESCLSFHKVLGMLAGLGGLLVIFNTDTDVGGDAIAGITAVLISVALHSGSTVAVKKINAQLPGLVTTTGGLLIAVPAYLATWLIFDGTVPVTIPDKTMASIVYLGFVGSALGFILYYYVLKNIEASKIALVPLVSPVIALVIGQRLNGEMIDQQIVYGAAMILSGLLFFQWGGLILGERKSSQHPDNDS